MRWKTLEFLGTLSSDNNNQTFGFKSTKCPPPINELANFENDMMQMVKNIQFRKINNNFQQILKKDIKMIKSNNKVFVPADKSRNIYKLENDEYSKLLKENVTKTYKESNFNKVRNINNKAKQITRTLKIYSDTKINYCKLCLLEKLYILDFIDDNRLLNKRSEFISGCKHHYKLLLKNVK